MSQELVDIGFKAESKGIKEVNRELNTMAKNGNSADKSITKLNAALSALGVTLGAREVIQYSDQWKQVNNQLKLVTDTEKELLVTRQELLGISRETNSELIGTVELYAELKRNSSDLGKSEEDLLAVTKTLNQLFLAGGKAASETAGAIRQLNQGLAAGALRGDEFNSVAEGAPKILDALSASLGKSKGELRDFAATGGITSAILIESLESYADTAQEMVNKIDRTFSQSMINANTNITEYIGNLDSADNAIAGLGNGIVSLTENLEHLEDAFIGGAVVVGGSYVASQSKALISSTATTTAILANNKKIAASELAKATSINLSSVQAQLAAKRSLAAAASDELRAKAITRLAMVNGAVIASEKAKTVALTQYTAAASAATLSTRALGVASSFLLGPLGLLTAALGVAAFAFVDSKDEADDATRAFGENKAEVDKLTESYSDYSKVRLGALSTDAHKEIIKLTIEQKKIQDELAESMRNSVQSSPGAVFDIQAAERQKELRDNLAEVNKEIKTQENVLDAVGNVFEQGIKNIDDWNERIKNGKELTGGLNTSNTKAIELFDKMNNSLQMQTAQLALGNDEYEIFELRAKLLAQGVIPEMVEQLVKLAEANQKLKNEGAASLELDKLVDDVDNFGGAWSRTGNIIVDTFGDMADAMDDYDKRLKGITKLEEQLAKSKEEFGEDDIRVKKAQAGIDEANEKARVSGIGAVAGATAQFFDEKTAASKALHALEMSMAVTEIAMSAQKMFASTGAGAAKLFEQGGWAGFAGVAAMIALLSQFGGGGSSSSSAPVSTGTALGGGDSNSIENSNDRLESIMVDQLTELRSIDDNLKSDASDINSLNVAIARQVGGQLDTLQLSTAFSNIFRGQDWLDKIRGEEDQSTTNLLRADYVESIQSVFSNISGTIDDSINMLGVDVASSAEDLIPEALDLGIDIYEQDSEKVIEAVNNLFSEQADIITEQLAPSLQEFQVLGEGMFDTLNRLAVSQVIFNDNLERTGQVFSELDTIDTIRANENIINLVGGIEEFQEVTNDFFESFFSEAEQFEHLENTLTDTFASLGLPLQTTTEGFKELVTGIDLSTTAGQELYASLLDIGPAMAEYIDQIEQAEQDRLQIEEDRVSLEIQLLNAQGEAEEALARQRQIELEATEESLRHLVEAIHLQEDLNKVEDEFNDSLSTTISNLEQSKESFLSLGESIDDALNASFGSSASLNLVSALSDAQAGNFEAAQGLDFSGLVNLDGSTFGSADELAIQQARNANNLKMISDLAAEQAQESTTQIDLLTEMRDTNNKTEEQIEMMREELKNAQILLQDATNRVASATEQIVNDGITVEVENP